MHELSLCRNIVAIATEHAGGRPLRRIAVRVGALAAVMPDALRFCFDVVTRGTPAEGARLDLREQAGRGRCPQCTREQVLQRPFGTCPECAVALEVTEGEDVRIIELETG